MTTMRRGFGSFLTLAAAFTVGTLAFAADPPKEKRPAGAPSNTRGISSVTDGQGNPVDLSYAAVTTNAAGMAVGPDASVVRRGRAWWPYSAALPPYGDHGKRVEEMTEDEIVVNATAALNLRDIPATHGRAPRELLVEPGWQSAHRDGFYLVKIKGFSRTQDQVDALTDAGAVLGEYLNINTYVAKIPSRDLKAVKALSFVSFVGDYQPAYKISPRIGMEEIPADIAIDPVTGQPNPWTFEVVLHKGVAVVEVLSELAQLSIYPEENDIVSNDDLNVLVVRANPETVPQLAKIPGVKWIAEKSYARLDASASNPATIPMVLQNNGAYTTTTGTGWKLWNAGVDGTGQIVTMMDSGLNTKMEHFAENVATHGVIGAGHRKVVAYESFGGGNLCVADSNSADGGHGTKTSQHAVGSISNMTVSPDVTHTPTVHWDNGIARGAKVYFQDIGTDAGSSVSPPLDLGPSITAAIAKGSFVQNHSWSAATNSYDTAASLLDTALFANPNFVATASSGNRGAIGPQTLGSPSTAKNVICVGGNDVSSPNNLFINCSWDGVAACATSDLGSSRGPVSVSGRIKPDIMTYIYSTSLVGGEAMASDLPTAMCQADATKTVYWNYQNTSLEGGTSFAAPEVAGLAALVRDYFIDGYYPTGAAVPANTLTPSGALVKAVILASGEDMAASSFPSASVIGKRYSADVGYGRANLPGALHLGNGAPFLWVQNNDVVGDSGTRTFFYNINNNTTPLRVMMVYYDAAGDALQKDADLKVTIGANVYWGNNFSTGWSTTATTTRDHTNPSEGVFLDAAHGLPASGSVRVDVLGFNNPGGLTYSLVVVGDVASTAFTQVSLDKGKYTCDQTVNITVNDAAGSSPASVTLVSKDAGAVTIDTQIVNCTGSNGVFEGSIQTGSGILVANGGSLTATYAGAASPAIATVACQVAASNQGFELNGGCDNAAAGADEVTGPLTNAGSNEFYNKYMDAGEATSYTFQFKNENGVPLTDVTVAVSYSGAGASKMTVFNSPVHIGAVAVDATVGAIFQMLTDASATGLTAVDVNFDITSPADGFTTPKRVTQPQLLQTNDQISRLQSCAPFNTSISPFFQSTPVTHPGITTLSNIWRWTGAATTPTAIGSELRTDGACNSATPNAAAMVGNSNITPATTNFANNADNFLYINFQPALRGNGPSGKPYHYVWKWHSFYYASEEGGNQSGVWGTFYNNEYNSSVAPTGDQLANFPFAFAYFYHTAFDYPRPGAGGTWNWDLANGGIPDDPHFNPNTGGAPNQRIIGFENATGLATATTYFAYGHQHADIFFFNGGTSHGTHRDIALDNDRLVYDEYYANTQAAASCGGGGPVGQVAFQLTEYQTCPSGSVVVSVVDANAVAGDLVEVKSPGTLDTELLPLTLVSGSYFTVTVPLSTVTGVGANNGTLFVLPDETITATYTDSSPVGSSSGSTHIVCTGGNVVYVSNAQISDNGDNDGVPDNNETVTVDITVQNNLAVPLTNAKVKIFADSPYVDCISDSEALYGTIAAGGSATNPGGDRFTFHVDPDVVCADPLNPLTARFIVVITGDGIDAPESLQAFSVQIELDATASGGSYNYTQNFDSDPGWLTAATPDDQATCGPYTNSFHWCAACGNAGGGYGAWIGNDAFGVGGQNYGNFDSSTLYSPQFVANGNVGLQFSLAYRTEDGYDGAIAQYRLNAGAWTTLAYATPAQDALFPDDFCSPFGPSQVAWNGTATGTTHNTTNIGNVPSSVGQAIQFRWRFGTDSSVVGTTYGGLSIDNVSITNLKQTQVCEPTRNTGLPICAPGSCTTSPDGTPCDDGNACTDTDECQSGTCAGTPVQPPAEATSLSASANKTTYTWAAVPTATAYDVVRGLLSALPVGPGGGDETCFPDLVGPTLVDATVPSPGTGYFYLARGENACANGTYGTQSNLTARGSTTCP